ncbi:MAG: DUF6106 family protein [Clostridia bacterium]
MDGPIEKLVTRKRDIVDYLSIVLVVIAAVLIQITTLFFSFLINYIAIIFAALLFLCTKFAMLKNIEFEYSYFDGDMEIDKIINMKKRKRVTLVSVKDMEAFGVQNAFATLQKKPEEIVYCCATPDAPGNYFFIANYNSKRTAFFFEPNDQMIHDIIRRIPNKILRGA